MTRSVAGAEEFYGELFHWEFRPGPPELGLYVRGLLDDREIVGIGQLQTMQMLKVAWTPYLATDDADVTAAAIRSTGGIVGVGPVVAGRAGRLAICSDPAGAVFGIWQADLHSGTGRTGTHGTPVRYELNTPETASVGAFYQGLFDYQLETSCSADVDRMALRVEGRSVATLHGVGASARGPGPHWLIYFEVDDPDASARLVAELGGHVIQQPQETEEGRFAIVADREGAVFAMVRSAKRETRTADR